MGKQAQDRGAGFKQRRCVAEGSQGCSLQRWHAFCQVSGAHLAYIAHCLI